MGELLRHVHVGRLLSNLKPVQLEISLDPKVFALKSRAFALLGAKALDFGAKAFDLESVEPPLCNPQGVSLGSICGRFGIHPGSIWDRSAVHLGSIWGRFII